MTNLSNRFVNILFTNTVKIHRKFHILFIFTYNVEKLKFYLLQKVRKYGIIYVWIDEIMNIYQFINRSHLQIHNLLTICSQIVHNSELLNHRSEKLNYRQPCGAPHHPTSSTIGQYIASCELQRATSYDRCAVGNLWTNYEY